MEIKTKLSTLWIVIMLNLIFADILSIMVELVNKNTLDIIGSDVTTTMAIAAIVTNIPILMIYFSKSLPYKANRITNIIAAIITIIYVVGGGSLTPHYVIIAGIEVLLLLMILISALKWKNPITLPCLIPVIINNNVPAITFQTAVANATPNQTITAKIIVGGVDKKQQQTLNRNGFQPILY